ncbi:unnamed protein product [Blepharisma stoltei]|uniref:Uncharacterized protein n=1 Tax=Blepharisma stoltei TaxID=1481888 RepID=A0AAU9III4_9CILI|nr:unnamed protein product [Blepharisma stoltei]
MPSPKRKRSRSREKEDSKDFKYTAATPKELKALLLQYMVTDKFSTPIDSQSLMRNLRMLFRSTSGRMMMRGFDLCEILKDLEEKRAIKLEPFDIGTKTCQMILTVNKDILQQLGRETSKDRPKKGASSSIAYRNDKVSWLKQADNEKIEISKASKQQNGAFKEEIEGDSWSFKPIGKEKNYALATF